MICPSCGCRCSDEVDSRLPNPNSGERVTIDVADLVDMATDRASILREGSFTQVLLMNCAHALSQLTERLAFYEHKIH
jgi:hypothetical protein